MVKNKLWNLLALVLAGALVWVSPAMAAEIRVLAVVIYKSSMPDLVSAFEKQTGHKVRARTRASRERVMCHSPGTGGCGKMAVTWRLLISHKVQ